MRRTRYITLHDFNFIRVCVFSDGRRRLARRAGSLRAGPGGAGPGRARGARGLDAAGLDRRGGGGWLRARVAAHQPARRVPLGGGAAQEEARAPGEERVL